MIVAKQVTVPNNIVFEQAQALLDAGEEVSLPFVGHSMLPTLRPGRDSVVIAPIRQPLHRGDVVLYRHHGKYLLHRILHVRKHTLVVRGDACAEKEQVPPQAVIGVLKSIQRTGTGEEPSRILPCQGGAWWLQSQLAMGHNALYQWGKRYFHQGIRKRLAPWYFALLLLLMWAPLDFLGAPLDNFVFGIRLDHLVHASVYIPCTWFLAHKWFQGKKWRTWSIGVLVAMTTEGVQYLLPYRGFDINDLVANILGMTIGWWIYQRHVKRRTSPQPKR